MVPLPSAEASGSGGTPTNGASGMNEVTNNNSTPKAASNDNSSNNNPSLSTTSPKNLSGNNSDEKQSQQQQEEEAVPVGSVAMKLLDVRLKPATAILQSLSGEFSQAGQHELIMLKAGGTIELYRILVVTDDEDEDEEEEESTSRTLLKLVTRVETRSILRAAVKVRFPGEKRDVLAVSADSGCLSVLDFSSSSETTGSGGEFASATEKNIILTTTFGKTAIRRAVEGQYLAADPAGRAVMISAVEKRKLVYVLNRDAAGKPTIASPLPAHKSRTITYATTALDCGYDNPVFAALERQYPEVEDYHHQQSEDVSEDCAKVLAYYELDLGLNHVSRKWAQQVHPTASCLAACPGGTDGPSGCLVGGEDYVEYVHDNIAATTEGEGSSSFHRIICAIPRRQLHPKDKGILVTTIAVHKQKRNKFFALAQTEHGDVYKVTVQTDPADKQKVTGLQVALLDTLPPANTLSISKLGMLFVAAEFGDHHLYQFERIDLPDATTSNSLETAEAFEKKEKESGVLPTSTGAAKRVAAFLTTSTSQALASTFEPTVLKNLRKVFSMENPSPTTGVMVGELAGNEVSPQIYSLTGRGPSSALRVSRHGASVTELAVSELPGIPGGIFTVAGNSNPAEETTKSKASGGQQHNDQYIVVSFADATLVLSVGETVEEVGNESGFLTNAPTLACSALGLSGAVCQVHPTGVRQIQSGQAKQWNCTGLKRIECASTNEAQVLIALAGGEIVYFELDTHSGNLEEAAKRDVGADVCCLDVGALQSGSSRSMFAAIGCRDQTVRIVSLESGKQLMQRSSTALKSRPHSVALLPCGDESGGGNDSLVLVIGLDDGSSLRGTVDPVTGSIGSSLTRRFLGARPVSVARIRLEGRQATLQLSSRPWMSRLDNQKHIMAPLSYAPLDHGCSFSSEAVREGVVATAGNTLRILSIDSSALAGAGDDEAFHTNKAELRYTPRQMTLLAATPSPTDDQEQRKVVLVVVESDYNDYGLEEKKAMGFDGTGQGKGSKKVTDKKGEDDDAMDMDVDSDDEDQGEKAMNEDADEEDEEDAEELEARKTIIRGPVPPSPGHWGSCVRLLDPSNGCETLDCLEMGRNEAALCCAAVRFHSKGGEPVLAVGTVTGMTLQPMKLTSSSIILYRVVNGSSFQLLHKTTVDDGPVLALAHFQGRLLVGIGKSLRLYEMGKRQLLRKSELRGLPTTVKTLQTAGDRIFCGDMMQSICTVRYCTASNRLIKIAADASPRPIVSQELLDWNTVAVGDKFGNISVMRLPRGADYAPAMATDVSGQRALWDVTRKQQDNMTTKLELLCQYYVGEVVTSMTRSSLVAGGAESLIYVTATGRIGALVPFTSRDDVEFYTQLESSLRTAAPRFTGRDPLAYRSYYAPVMHVVDGDLCAAFHSLTHDEQTKIAERMDRTPAEIMKKLEDTRNGLL